MILGKMCVSTFDPMLAFPAPLNSIPLNIGFDCGLLSLGGVQSAGLGQPPLAAPSGSAALGQLDW